MSHKRQGNISGPELVESCWSGHGPLEDRQAPSLFTQSQSSHSPVSGEVSVTSLARFPSAASQAWSHFAALIIYSELARWRGNSCEGMNMKSPKDSTEGPETPSLSKFEDTFIKHKDSVRREKQNAS